MNHWIANWTAEHVIAAAEVAIFFMGVLVFGQGIYEYRKKNSLDLAEQKRRNDEFERQNEEFARQNRLNRFERFHDMQQRYFVNPSVQAVLRRIYKDDFDKPDSSHGADRNDKQNFMGFHEELAFMVNSDLITKEIAYYTMGLDALAFWESETTWRDDPEWQLFNSLAQSVKVYRANLPVQITEVDNYKF